MTTQLPAAAMLTRAQVRELLNINITTLDKLTKTGRIPCYRIGTAVRYDPADIADYLDSIRIGPSTPGTEPTPEPAPEPAPTGRRRRARPHPFS